MKVLQQEHMSESQLEAICYEPRLIFELEHPNILRVFDAGLLESHHGSNGYFVTEYVPSGSLRKYLRDKPNLPLMEAVTLARQICEGMAFAHVQWPPIIHRDLKPENILIRYEGDGLRAKVSDFGLATYVNEMSQWTSTAGTFLYKPPEAFKNLDSVAGDVFAIGMILYEMLTGELPFPTESVHIQKKLERLLVAARRKPPQAPSSINLAVDTDLDDILQIALAFRPQDRYRSAVEFLEALRDYEQRMHTPTSTAADRKSAAVASPRQVPATISEAPHYLSKALETGRRVTDLADAINYLERAMTLDASLRPQYTKLLRQWKMGIVM
jgi:serine/threonine-protein kinase